MTPLFASLLVAASRMPVMSAMDTPNSAAISRTECDRLVLALEELLAGQWLRLSEIGLCKEEGGLFRGQIGAQQHFLGVQHRALAFLRFEFGFRAR